MEVSPEIANEMTFGYWKKLGELGWQNLNGGGPSLWADNPARCITASLTLMPQNKDSDYDPAANDFFVIWIGIAPIANCKAAP